MGVSEAWLQEAIDREVEGVELVAAEHAGGKGQKILRLFIDREGGVDHGLCSRVSEAVGRALDEADKFSGPYTLEVSSPGLERPLRKREHFESQVGKKIYVKTRTPVEGAKVWQGRLVRVTVDKVLVDDGSRQVSIALNDITRAHLIFEFE